MDRCELRPAILELTGHEVDEQILRLRAFEQDAAELVRAADAEAEEHGKSSSQLSLCAHYLLSPGTGPGMVTDPALQQVLASDNGPPAAIACDGENAHKVRYNLRCFAAQQFALVERSLHGRLTAFW